MDNNDSFISSKTVIKKNSIIDLPIWKRKKMTFIANQMLLSWKFLAF